MTETNEIKETNEIEETDEAIADTMIKVNIKLLALMKTRQTFMPVTLCMPFKEAKKLADGKMKFLDRKYIIYENLTQADEELLYEHLKGVTLINTDFIYSIDFDVELYGLMSKIYSLEDIFKNVEMTKKIKEQVNEEVIQSALDSLRLQYKRKSYEANRLNK